MVYRVTFSEQASDDLDRIIRYICYDLSNPSAASRFYVAVNDKLDLLRGNPYIYPLYHDDKLNALGYRFIIIGNYLLFFLIDNDSAAVSIVRILYGKRNVSSIL